MGNQDIKNIAEIDKHQELNETIEKTRKENENLKKENEQLKKNLTQIANEANILMVKREALMEALNYNPANPSR